MELRDFVSESLKQIMDGVVEAQKYAKEKETGALVNPHPEHVEVRKGSTFRVNVDAIEKVAFDVVTGEEDATSGDGKVGIKVLSVVDLGGGVLKSKTATAQNRLSFQVPIAYPFPE